MTKARKEAMEATGSPCPGCSQPLIALYHITVCAPHPFPGFTKAAFRASTVSIVAADHDLTAPFCGHCGWTKDAPKSQSDVIQTLMRELIERGMKPTDLQGLLKESNTSAVDMLAACHPKLSEG
jgi:hypothetical protein